MRRQSLLRGTFVLLTASVYNRLLGFGYQIGMVRLLKPEGVGLFNMVYPVYVMLLVIASAGLPVAVAKLGAEAMARNDRSRVKKIFVTAFIHVFFISTAVATAVAISGPFLSRKVFANPASYYCFMCLLPAVIIVSLCSVLRGFFQSLQTMTPTALSQMLEQTIRVTAGLLIAGMLLPRGLEFAALGLSCGVVAGEFCGLLLMLFFFIRHQPFLAASQQVAASLARSSWPIQPFWSISLSLYRFALPVTLTRFVASALLSLDAILIPRCLLASGLDLTQATGAYGQLVGIAETLLFMPTMLTIALATALLPAVSEAASRQQWPLVAYRLREALRLSLLAGLPAAAIFYLLPRELCGLIFGYPQAGNILALLAYGAPFLYTQQIFIAVLQGIGRPDIPLKNLLLASTVKVILIITLTLNPALQIRGTAIALSCYFFLLSAFNYLSLRRLTGITIFWPALLARLLLSSSTAALVMATLRTLFLPVISLSETVILLLVGGFAYLLILFLSGEITRRDLARVMAAIFPSA